MATDAPAKPICVLCGNRALDAQPLYAEDGALRTAGRYQCRTCGVYGITYLLRSWIEKNFKTNRAERVRLQAITRNASERGEWIELSSEDTPDALEPEVFDMLVAQGYFVADAYLKIRIPGVLRDCCGDGQLNDPDLRPAWDWAQKVIASANAHPEHAATVLRTASRSSKLWGRCETMGLRIQLGGFASFALVMCLVVMAVAFWGLVQAGIRLWDAL